MQMKVGMLNVLSAIAVAVASVSAAHTPNIAWYNTTETSFNISTADQLLGLAQIVNGTAIWAVRDDFNGKVVTLTQNIDLADYTDWAPIGRTAGSGFAGTFDGGRHVISNLTINRPDSINQGLFGMIDGGTVKRLGVENVHITGGVSVGALAGYLDGGTVTDCYTTGSVRGADSAGGVAGTAVDGSRITNTYSTVAVSGDGFLGGIAGYVTGSNVTDCAALNPEVRGDSYTSSTGRVVGRADGGGPSNNVAYAGMGNSAGDTVWMNKGGAGSDGEDITLVGIKASGSISGRFASPTWETENGKLPGYAAAIALYGHFVTIYRVTVTPSEGLLVGKNTLKRTFSERIIGEHSNKTVKWTVIGHSSQNSTDINSTSGVLNVTANENSDFIRVIATSNANSAKADTVTVTVVDVAWYVNNQNPPSGSFSINTPSELAGLAAIVNGTWGGTATLPAMDSFAGKTVKLAKNIDLERYKNWIPIGNRAADSLGSACTFAGKFNGAGYTVENLTINAVNKINANNSQYAGLFSHVVRGGSVDSLRVVNANISGDFAAGGVVGRLLDSSTVSNSSSGGTISATEVSGGVAGVVERAGNVIRCYSTAAVSGGVAGGVAGIVDTFSVVTNTYFAGAVSGTVSAGGVAGRVGLGTTVEDSYSAGTVSGINKVGGVAGVLSASKIITSYSTGAVSGADSVGGVAGYVTGASSVENCVALTSGVASVGASAGRIIGSAEYLAAGILKTNAAYDGMVNRAGNTAWTDKGADAANGADISVLAIRIDPSIGGRFTGINGWTTASDRLPGFDTPVEFPAYFGPVVYEVSVTPTDVLLARGKKQQFTVNVSANSGVGSRDVIWSVFGDGLHPETAISANGLLIVAANDSAASIIVRATSVVDDTKYGMAVVTPVLSGAVMVTGMVGAVPRVGETLTASIGGGFTVGRLNYTWTIGGTVSPSSDSTYKITESDEGKVITLVVRSDVEAGSLSKTLGKVDPADAPINAPRATITKQPESDTVVIGTKHSLSVAAVATGDLHYRWFSVENQSGQNGKILSSIADTLLVPTNKLGTYYYFAMVANVIEDNRDGGIKTALDTSDVVAITVVEFTSVASPDRVIPNDIADDIAIAAPVRAITGELTAGPNPTGRSSGQVNFYRSGKQIKSGQLTLYDASGNAVGKVPLTDNAGTPRRLVGSWNLTDRKGRPVAEGTYLLRGSIVTADGQKERVSLKIGIR